MSLFREDSNPDLRWDHTVAASSAADRHVDQLNIFYGTQRFGFRVLTSECFYGYYFECSLCWFIHVGMKLKRSDWYRWLANIACFIQITWGQISYLYFYLSIFCLKTRLNTNHRQLATNLQFNHHFVRIRENQLLIFWKQHYHSAE